MTGVVTRVADGGGSDDEANTATTWEGSTACDTITQPQSRLLTYCPALC